MNTFKNISKLTFAFIMMFTFLATSSTFAQDAKVIEMDGLNTLKFSKEAITAKPGQEITVKLTNVTKLPAAAMSHNFVLLTQGVDATKFSQSSAKFNDNDYIDPDMEDQVIAHTTMAAGGETVEVTFKVPEKPGDYTYVCTFPGHYLGGMEGTLTVK